MTILLFFGGLAALLAALGVYGLFSWSVALRTRELAIRLTLGARPSSVGALVIGQSAILVVAGLAVGLVIVRLAETALTRVVFGVTTTDVWALASASALLLVAAIIACVPAGIAGHAKWIPSRDCERSKNGATSLFRHSPCRDNRGMTQSITVNGLRLYYRDNGTGEPLLLLHGFTGSGDDWSMSLPNRSPSSRDRAGSSRPWPLDQSVGHASRLPTSPATCSRCSITWPSIASRRSA